MPHEKSPEQSSRAEQIAHLNDEFRRSGPNQNWVATVGAIALSDFPGLIKTVQDFDTFTPDNDPHGEQDFGGIDWHQERTFWKIDYYDQELQYWHDPLSEACRRVLTVLLASEY